ncbi:MAG: bifunctional lysylphosphatidylglycerol flippase/synthetase MprF [Bacteroidales bacterium]
MPEQPLLPVDEPADDDRSSPERRAPLVARLETLLVWLLGHAPRFVPFVVIAVVLAATWGPLRSIHPREVRAALHVLDSSWLALAALATLANIVVMGLYDVMAFAHTRSRSSERWRYGAVAFAWSNFLTLGPLAGPAIRFWLYRPSVDRSADIEGGVINISAAFIAGLAGWTLAALVVPHATAWSWLVLLAGIALVVSVAVSVGARRLLVRLERFSTASAVETSPVALALIGWLDWLLAAIAFVACVRSAGIAMALIDVVRSFFFGQAIGLASLVPGGFGSADAFWIVHLPIAESTATATLLAYRLIYYVVPWAAASLLLLTWVTHRTPRRVEVARRVMAGIIGASGALMLLSTATPGLHTRLTLLEQLVPLPLVEVGTLSAAVTGLLLLVLARGLAKGYRAAFSTTIILLIVASISSILKGFDYEEALVLSGVALLALAQAPLFDRPSQGDFIESRDLGVAFVALIVFLVFGVFAHRVTAVTIERLSHVGYRSEAVRFLRTGITLAMAFFAGAAYLLLRVPVRFARLSDNEIDRALELNAEIGGQTTPMMVANGDKSVFFDTEPGATSGGSASPRGFCLYRTTGPYMVVFSDPVVRTASDRAAFLNSLFAFAGDIDRRPVFYQISLDWIPPLHDRGYAFFKLGEEAQVALGRVTLDGPGGKLYRQVLRRAERDGVRFRVLPPFEAKRLLPQLGEISNDWLQAKGVRERQFSIGFFDEAYLALFPIAVIEDSAGRIIAFANLLQGPRREELSIDLMRYRSDAPKVMDFLFVSLFLWGKEKGYRRFNLGMAPLASVGELAGAHLRERLANLLFQHGENWYNFQGLRQYKEKFEPDWVPRYMAYQNTWEWPAAIAYVSALIAGGWSTVLLGRD